MQWDVSLDGISEYIIYLENLKKIQYDYANVELSSNIPNSQSPIP